MDAAAATAAADTLDQLKLEAAGAAAAVPARERGGGAVLLANR